VPFDLRADTDRDAALPRQIDKVLFPPHPSTDPALRPSLCFHPETGLQTPIRSCSWGCSVEFLSLQCKYRPCLAGNTRSDPSVLQSLSITLSVLEILEENCLEYILPYFICWRVADQGLEPWP